MWTYAGRLRHEYSSKADCTHTSDVRKITNSRISTRSTEIILDWIGRNYQTEDRDEPRGVCEQADVHLSKRGRRIGPEQLEAFLRGTAIAQDNIGIGGSEATDGSLCVF